MQMKHWPLSMYPKGAEITSMDGWMKSVLLAFTKWCLYDYCKQAQRVAHTHTERECAVQREWEGYVRDTELI